MELAVFVVVVFGVLVVGGALAIRHGTIRPDRDPFVLSKALLDGGTGDALSTTGAWRGLDVSVTSGTAAHGAPAVLLEARGDFGEMHVRERPSDVQSRSMAGGRQWARQAVRDVFEGDQKVGDLAFDERFVVTKTDLALLNDAVCKAALAVRGATVCIEPRRVAIEYSYGSRSEEELRQGLNHLYNLAVSLGVLEPSREDRLLDPKEDADARAWLLYTLAGEDPVQAASLAYRVREQAEAPDSVVAAAADVVARAYPDRDEPDVLADLRRLLTHRKVRVAVSAIRGLGFRGDVSDVAALRARAKGMLVDARLSGAVEEAVARLQANVDGGTGGVALAESDGGGVAIAEAAPEP